MGRLNNGIFGGFTGKVGNVIGSSCRGVEYIKSMPTKMTNPRTKDQTKQRSSFIITQNFLRTFTPIIRVGFQDYAVEGKSAFNAAMSYNMLNSIKTGTDGNELDYPNILISKGSLFTSTYINAKLAKDDLYFEWDSTFSGNANNNDQVMVLAFNSTKTESIFDINAGKRKNASTFLSLPSHWKGDIIETYIAFKNEEGSIVSNSCYTGSLTA